MKNLRESLSVVGRKASRSQEEELFPSPQANTGFFTTPIPSHKDTRPLVRPHCPDMPAASDGAYLMRSWG